MQEYERTAEEVADRHVAHQPVGRRGFGFLFLEENRQHDRVGGERQEDRAQVEHEQQPVSQLIVVAADFGWFIHLEWLRALVADLVGQQLFPGRFSAARWSEKLLSENAEDQMTTSLMVHR